MIYLMAAPFLKNLDDLPTLENFKEMMEKSLFGLADFTTPDLL